MFQKNTTNRVIKKIVFKIATRSGTMKDFTVKDCIFLPTIPGKNPAKSLGIIHIINVPTGFMENSIVPKGSSPKTWTKLLSPKASPRTKPTFAPKIQVPTATGIVIN